MDRPSLVTLIRSTIVGLTGIFALILLSSCVEMFQRSDESGYSRGGDGPMRGEIDRNQEKAQLKTDEASDELGISHSESLDPQQRRALQTRMELKRLEKSSLDTRSEKEQYYKVKSLFASDADRIDFLRIGSFEGRERYLRRAGISSSDPRFSAEVRDLIEQNDVALGMSRQAVRQSWGEPETVEVAGNPVYGNERWKYIEQVASPDGYQTENRLIYFEGGRVVGWEKF